MLSDKLDKKDIIVFYANDDANTLISTTAIKAVESSEVIVVCNDTDIIVLLWHKVDMHGLYAKTPGQVWSVRLLVQFGMQYIIMLIHAITGCDTTSRIYGVGKDNILKSLRLVKACRDVVSVFYAPNTLRDVIEMEREINVSCVKS